jgi:hypothetical protein
MKRATLTTAVLAATTGLTAAVDDRRSEADTLYTTEDAFAKATGITDKGMFKIDGARHIEPYRVAKYVQWTG